jgi:hypothetical protein
MNERTDITEHQFTALVEELAAELGLLTHFCADARKCRGYRGFPDLVIAGPAGVIFAELKVADRDTGPLQNLWLWTLDSAVGRSALVHAVKWRPADLDSGVIRQYFEDLVRPDPQRNNRRPRASNVRDRRMPNNGSSYLL